jgi:hypothetical protein
MFHAKALECAQVIPIAEIVEEFLLNGPETVSAIRTEFTLNVALEIVLVGTSIATYTLLALLSEVGFLASNASVAASRPLPLSSSVSSPLLMDNAIE